MDLQSKQMPLTQFYDELKSKVYSNNPSSDNLIDVGNDSTPIESPGSIRWRAKANQACRELKDNCCKHIVLDIYCKILPFDNDYVQGNMGQMKSDIDNMLSDKKLSGTEYLKSCQESTNAPLLDFINRSIEQIGRSFLEASEEKLKDAKEKDIKIPDPDTPSVDDEEVSNQLVDIKQDPEYENFIDKLKKKTIDKIVSDVSKIITTKKEENNMSFDPKPIADEKLETESAVSIGLDYIQKRLLKENANITNPTLEDEMMGLCIREATLNQMDTVFNLPNSNLRNFSTKIRLNKGVLINESAIQYFIENANN